MRRRVPSSPSNADYFYQGFNVGHSVDMISADSLVENEIQAPVPDFFVTHERILEGSGIKNRKGRRQAQLFEQEDNPFRRAIARVPHPLGDLRRLNHSDRD